MATTNRFVKFSRGLFSQYNSLINKDPDTLYLVYSEEDSQKGSLYLGDRLISSVDNTEIHLSDLIEGTPTEGTVLQYNANTGGGVWEPVLLPSISSVDSTDTITAPNMNDIAIVDKDAYVYDGEKWIHLTNSDLESQISALETAVGTPADSENNLPSTGLYKEIDDLRSDVRTQIADANHLKYEVITSLTELEGREDTENIVFLVPNGSENEDDGYDEYFVIQGKIEKIGTWGVNSDQLLTTEQKQKIDSLGKDDQGNATIPASRVTNLNDLITTTIAEQQLIRSVDSAVFDLNTDTGYLTLKEVPAPPMEGYVQQELFNTTVTNLKDLIGDESKLETNSVISEIELIKESIVWQELGQSNSNGN